MPRHRLHIPLTARICFQESRTWLAPYAALPANRAGLESLLALAGVAEAAWNGLERGLDERLGRDAPSLRRIPEALSRLARVAGGLLAERSFAPGRAEDAIDGEDRIAPTPEARSPMWM